MPHCLFYEAPLLRQVVAYTRLTDKAAPNFGTRSVSRIGKRILHGKLCGLQNYILRVLGKCTVGLQMRPELGPKVVASHR